MPCTVYLTDAAASDIDEIFNYIAAHDSLKSAMHVLDHLEKVIAGLAGTPQRGVYPKELLAVGIREYREVFYKPYRVIYRFMDNAVYIYLVADGRRDMQELLQRRLFGA